MGARPGVLLLAAGVVLGGWALTGVYDVGPGERGEVTRFGALVSSSGPGLNYHLPAPIEQVRVVSTTALNTLELGGPSEDAPQENGLMQTSDGDILDLAYAVRWRVAEPEAYLLGSTDPDGALKTAAMSVMSALVAQTPVQQVMGGRARLQALAASRTQALMNADGTGLTVASVEIHSADPPPPVAGAFRQAVAAGKDVELGLDEANAYRARTLAKAKAEAARTVADAQGQAQGAAVEARSQATAFATLDAAYRADPDQTRRRLYLDTLRQVLDHAAKLVVDAPNGAPIVLQPGMVRDPSAAAPATPDRNASATAPPR